MYLEQLECRVNPSVYLSGADLIVEGTALNDTIEIDYTDLSAVLVNLNSVNYGPFDVSAGQIQVLANVGNNDELYLENGSNIEVIVTGSSAGSFDGHTFTSAEFIQTGAGDDTFSFPANTGSVLNGIDAGAGVNTLDYTGRTNPVAVNLATGTATSLGGIAGIVNVIGGSGKDRLFGDGNANILGGGDGDDLILGHGGNDTLYGGDGRDVIFGGFGSDVLDGGDGDDLLLGGVTDWDANITALTRIQLEWTRTNANYATRVSHLNGTLGGGYNSSFYLNSSTVTDTESDTLTGGNGQDWFVSDTGDVNDLTGSESFEVV